VPYSASRRMISLCTAALLLWPLSTQRCSSVVIVGGAFITTLQPPTEGLGYAGLCGGHAASQAAPYVGDGPHPIDFEGGSAAGFADVNDNAGVLQDEPSSWEPATAADVQLVACVSGTQTPNALATCEYIETNVPMDAAGDAVSNPAPLPRRL
jgi:hypothetical protein